jgi:shikimate kinase
VIPDRIFLVGFMGSGKTEVGKLLADRLGRLFIDLDQLVESGARATVAEIFEKEGESGFRNRERRALVSAATGPPAVVATGGGTYADRGNRRTIEEAGVAIWIATPFENCLERCQEEIGKRPLFRDEESLEALFEARRSDYAAAAFTVETLNRNPEIVADDVIQRLEDAIWSTESFR